MSIPKLSPTFKEVSIDKLVKASWNYKNNDDAMLEKLVANMEKNGQVETILVRELPTGALEVVNGNHRYDALMRMGTKKVMVCSVGKITDARARRLAVELNETGFPNDPLRLGEILREITTEFTMDESLESLPYDAEQLEKLLRGGNWPTERPGKSGEDPGDMIAIRFLLDFEQHEVWTRWKMEAGTDNDVLALLRAVGDALKWRKYEKENASPPSN